MANTVVWNKHDYVARMRSRVNRPQCWMDVLNVKYTNNRTVVNSYMSTEPTAVAGTRGTAYVYGDFTLTADTLTIDGIKMIPVFIDEADRHQQTYVNQMTIADFQGKKIGEKIESLMLAEHSSWNDFGVGDLANTSTDDTTKITVSATNIDDIIRAIKRKLYKNNGVDKAVENGIFIIWRPEDYELLEGFVQANGYTEADIALKNGIPVQKGFYYGGVTNYLSNDHTANHIFAGIKRQGELGILSGTFGQVKFIEDPGLKSGLGIVSRLDYGFNWPAQLDPFYLDVNVN